MKNRLTQSILLVAVLFLATTAVAGSNPVVIKMGNKTVTTKDIKNLHANGPDQVKKAPIEVAFRPLRDQEVLRILIEDAKSKANLSNDEEVVKALNEARAAIELQVFLKRAIKKRITEEKLRGLYNELTQKMKNQKEFEVGVIIVGDKDTANKVLNDLNAGKDFGSLAQQYSLEPTAKKNSGNVGYLLEGTVAAALGPDVASSLKILKDNVHSKKAIQTKDGKYLIVRRGNSRAAVVPPFDQLKPQLENLYAQKALMEYVEELAKASDLKVYTLEGKEDVFKLTSSPAPAVAAKG